MDVSVAQSAAPGAEVAAAADPLGGQAYFRAAPLRGRAPKAWPHAKTLTAVALELADHGGETRQSSVVEVELLEALELADVSGETGQV